mmetsp:Transcript_6516/g.10193  ORF Transcript_6516/g.10193 Transcript_6516/m.10193 type:complete len:639 (+) Transcript_6516:135-2051(+)
MPSVEGGAFGVDWQAFVYLNVFLACSSFSCALPTIEPYLAELNALPLWAYAVAIYSVGQFLASPLWGYLCSIYRSEHALYASLLIGILGGFLYATARSGVEILIARLLIGLYTGSQEACHRTIVVRCTTDTERTIAQAGVSTATVLGFLFGPALAGIFFFKSFGPVNLLGMSFRLDTFTGPGWLIVFFCFISFFFVSIGLTQEQTKGLPQCISSPRSPAAASSSLSLPSSSSSFPHHHPASSEVANLNDDGDVSAAAAVFAANGGSAGSPSPSSSSSQFGLEANAHRNGLNDNNSSSTTKNNNNANIGEKFVGRSSSPSKRRKSPSLVVVVTPPRRKKNDNNSISAATSSSSISSPPSQRRRQLLAHQRDNNDGAADYGHDQKNVKMVCDDVRSMKMPMKVAGLFVCGMVLFVNALGFSAYETITTPLVKNDFGWDLFYADVLFVAAGIVCILVFFIIKCTSASVEDRYLLLCGVVFSTIGYGLMLEFFDNRLPLPRFLMGFAAVNAAMELNRSVTMSLASKILHPKSPNHGLLQGMLISCVACARIIGPVYAVWVWDATDTTRFSQGHWVFLGLFVCFIITTIVYGACFSVLRPYKVLYEEWLTEEEEIQGKKHALKTPLLKTKLDRYQHGPKIRTG